MFINILLKIHFEVDKQLSIMYYMLSLKETFLRRSINEYCYHSFYVVIIGAMMYFMAIKPQKKEQKRQQELMDSMEIGDYVLTTSGFYGVLIDISDDDVIVEFGNNKNCRISMQKKAIAQVEKPSDSTSAE